MAFQIRRATAADSANGINTLRRSISELCVADHLGDAQEIQAWLANKTVEAWAKWIRRADAVVLVADRNSEVVGVGMTTTSGEVLLNYVRPDARFCRVSTAILFALEDELRSRGVYQCHLESTVTARMFYERRGFRPDAANVSRLSKLL